MIRVLRVLEYEYDDEQRMVEDMGKWTIQLDVLRMKMKSATVAFSHSGEPYQDADA